MRGFIWWKVPDSDRVEVLPLCLVSTLHNKTINYWSKNQDSRTRTCP